MEACKVCIKNGTGHRDRSGNRIDGCFYRLCNGITALSPHAEEVLLAEIHHLGLRPNFDTARNGSPYSTVENFRRLLRGHAITVRYNEIRKEIDIAIPGKNFLPDNYQNCCLAELYSLCEQYRMGTKHLLKFTLMVADENKYNPVVEWLESKPWDGLSRIQEFFETIVSTDEEMKRILLHRWMLSAVAAAYEPTGISAGGMLVLVGQQYIGKTNWFKNLVPDHKRDLIRDGMSVDPHDRDSFMPCLEHWLVELGEIDATFRRSDLAALKAFINRDRDITRLSYATSNSRFPRRTIFFGSVDKKSYLTDPAGNRRFWTVECKEINHTHGINMQQVWAEYAVLYHDREPWLLTSEEHKRLTTTNQKFEVINPMEEKLRAKYEWGEEPIDWKTATQILEDLGYTKPSRSHATTCGLIVRKLNMDREKTVRGVVLLGLPRPTRESLFP